MATIRLEKNEIHPLIEKVKQGVEVGIIRNVYLRKSHCFQNVIDIDQKIFNFSNGKIYERENLGSIEILDDFYRLNYMSEKTIDKVKSELIKTNQSIIEDRFKIISI